MSEKRKVFVRLVKNQGFKDNRMTQGGSDAIGTSTTLESNNPTATLDLAFCLSSLSMRAIGTVMALLHPGD